jgi:hypothetical protein
MLKTSNITLILFSNSSFEMRFGSLALIAAPEVVVEKGRLVKETEICLFGAAADDGAHESETKL